MHRFEALDDVQSALQKLMQRDPALVKVLPRQPGTKESRWVQLMSGDVVVQEHENAQRVTSELTLGDRERVDRLEEKVAALRREVGELKSEFERFRQQFQ